jgi:hypothetical protein
LIARWSIAAVALLLLSACSQKVDLMTPDESHHKLLNIFDETQEAVGGTWEKFLDLVPGECKKIDGRPGIQFSDARSGDSPGTNDDAKKVADQVAVLWATRGYKVTQSFAGELGYEVFATNKGMSDLSFGANFRAMSLLGGSECVDGNVAEILEKLPKPTTGLKDRD